MVCCFLVLDLFVFREMLDHFVQRSPAEHVRRGKGEGIAQTERIEIIDVVVHALMIDLVDHQNNGLAAFAQHRGHVFVVGSHAGAAIGEKEDDVAGVDRDFGLTAHLLEQNIICFRFDSAGVDQRKFVIEPFAVCINAVAGYAGCILHNGNAAACNFVKEGRFAYIRAADDRDKGFGHGYSSVPRRA